MLSGISRSPALAGPNVKHEQGSLKQREEGGDEKEDAFRTKDLFQHDLDAVQPDDKAHLDHQPG